MNAMLKPLALTTGDPAGIGPELCLKVASDPQLHPKSPVVLLGSSNLLRRVSKATGLDVTIQTVASADEAGNTPGVVYVLDIPLDADAVTPGKVSDVCGQAVWEAIALSVNLAMRGEVSAICCAPANKESFNAAGHHFEGQTEIYAELTHTKQFHTILVGGPLRVSLVSSHCSLAEAVTRVKTARVERILKELNTALHEKFGIDKPRIGVAGLNPHAGENGLFGREEIEQVQPAVDICRTAGIDVTSPLSADSLFFDAEQGKYDAVLAMYHDQGTIPLKRYGYVTYAANLPLIRTTAGHGTAFDIAWRGIANPEVLARALKLAEELATPKHKGKTDECGAFHRNHRR